MDVPISRTTFSGCVHSSVEKRQWKKQIDLQGLVSKQWPLWKRLRFEKRWKYWIILNEEQKLTDSMWTNLQGRKRSTLFSKNSSPGCFDCFHGHHQPWHCSGHVFEILGTRMNSTSTVKCIYAEGNWQPRNTMQKNADKKRICFSALYETIRQKKKEK